MEAPEVVSTVSFFILGGLIAFQSIHYLIGALRFWRDHPRKLIYTCLLMLFWVAQGLFFLTYVPSLDSYVKAAPLVVTALNLPPLLILLALMVSSSARKTVDRVSLKWSIASVEGPARIIAGMTFIVWFFAGMLPGYFAWVAGPGDMIAGVVAFVAVAHLRHLSTAVEIQQQHWSATDFLQAVPQNLTSQKKQDLQRHLFMAISLVAFGILDFILAPASSGWSIIMGKVPPEALGQLPLGFIPMILVPQVFALEIIAMRQLLVMRKTLLDT